MDMVFPFLVALMLVMAILALAGLVVLTACRIADRYNPRTEEEADRGTHRAGDEGSDW
jgi:hypothetical protein